MLVVVASGDSASNKAGRDTTTSSTTSITSTAPTSSTTNPATPLPRSTNPAVSLAQQYDGRYVGTFTNSTFQTSGPATLEVRIDPATGDMTLRATFDGDLFGGGSKISREITGTVRLGGDPSSTSLTADTQSFGKVTASLASTFGVVLDAPDVPDPKVKGFLLSGVLDEKFTGFSATFTVAFDDGGTATGTVTTSCAPEGQRPSEVPTLCSRVR